MKRSILWNALYVTLYHFFYSSFFINISNSMRVTCSCCLRVLKFIQIFKKHFPHFFCSYIRTVTCSNHPVTNSQITKGEGVCWGGGSCGWAREEPSAKSTWSVTWSESCRNQIYPTVQVLWAKPTHSRRINSLIVYPAKATFMDTLKKSSWPYFAKTERSYCIGNYDLVHDKFVRLSSFWY
jgi:hypothetical protein